MRIRPMAGALALASTLAVTACGSDNPKSSSSGSTSTTSSTAVANTSSSSCGQKTVGYVDIFASSPTEARINALAKKSVEALGWKFDFVDAAGDITKYQQAVQGMVTKHVDLIMAASVDAAPIRQALLAAKAADIPVVEVGGGNLDPQHLFSATYNEDETLMGNLLAAHIAKTVPDAQIGDLATSLNYSGVARENGLKAALAKAGTGKIVADEQVDTSNPTVNTAKTLTDMLTGHPEINAVWAVFDSMSAPAANVIRTKGSKAKLFSFYASPSNLALMKKGQLAAVVDPNLPLTAPVAIDQYLNTVKNGAKFDPAAVDKAGGLGYRIVTSPDTSYDDNATLAPFLKKWQSEC